MPSQSTRVVATEVLKPRLGVLMSELKDFAKTNNIDLFNRPLSFLYSNYEIAPVKRYFDENNINSFCEVCDTHEADFWSVYARFVNGTAQCIADCKDVHTAVIFYEKCTTALKFIKRE